MMLEKLGAVEARYEEISHSLSDPSVVNDRERFRKLSQEHSDLTPVVETFRKYRQVDQELLEAEELLFEAQDPEMRAMALDEKNALVDERQSLEQELLILLLPKDPNDHKNTILEMRAGTGGDEASLFTENLFNAYTRFCQARGWTVDIMSSSAGTMGGYKEVIALINGYGAYSIFKYESGVHRVQRVPATESQGRIHTSTITVAVLPEAEEVDIEVKETDLRIDVYRSGGPGGQSVNTTDSAVRITHNPSGLVVTCQDEKSQHKNKAKAMAVLRARLLDIEQQKQANERGSDRKSQIGSGERSEKIRTYNYPQSRVTDHRIGLTVYQLDTVMAGNLDLMIQPLIAHFQAEALKSSSD